jgi:hypothetical protein
LIFDTDERGPDTDLRLAFEAANRLDDEGKQLLKPSPKASSSAKPPAESRPRPAEPSAWGRRSSGN